MHVLIVNNTQMQAEKEAMVDGFTPNPKPEILKPKHAGTT
jgi:hypothetical protein